MSKTWPGGCCVAGCAAGGLGSPEVHFCKLSTPGGERLEDVEVDQAGTNG